VLLPSEEPAKWLYRKRSYDCLEAKTPDKSLKICTERNDHTLFLFAREIHRSDRLSALPACPVASRWRKRRTHLVRKTLRAPLKTRKNSEKLPRVSYRPLKNIENFSIGIAVAISEARGNPLLKSTPLMTLQQTQESMTWR
jgi:hypothetical protein